MARSKRTNFAKAKVWQENMSSEIEGQIGGVAIMMFQSIEKPAVRALALQKMQDWHAKMLEREQQAAAVEADSTSA
ncbi:hypothetical protein [Pseudomonas syringae]|nr:hypothetical protein [Pseudomonas syringae]